LGGPLSKLCVTSPFSIKFRCQIENQVSDYRLLGASSYFFNMKVISLSLDNEKKIKLSPLDWIMDNHFFVD
jgi:hypothetical protein